MKILHGHLVDPCWARWLLEKQQMLQTDVPTYRAKMFQVSVSRQTVSVRTDGGRSKMTVW